MRNLAKILFLLFLSNFVYAQKTTIYADKYIIRGNGVKQTKFITNKGYFKNTFMLGDTTVTQSEPFQVTLNARFDGKLNIAGNYGSIGSYLRSGGSGALPTWGLVDWSEIANKPTSVNAWAKIPLAGETLLGIGNTNTDKFMFGSNGVKIGEFNQYGYFYGWSKIGVNTGYNTSAGVNDFAYRLTNNYSLSVGGSAMFGFHSAMPIGQKIGTYFADIAKEVDGDIGRIRFTKYEASGAGNVAKWYLEHGINNDFSIKKVNIGYSIDTTNSMYINAGKYSFGRSTAINGNKFSFEGTGTFSGKLTVPLLNVPTGAVFGSVLTSDSSGNVSWKSGVEQSVLNISTLRVTTGKVRNQRILTLGYYAVGDGGGGNFYWDASSTTADNGGTIIQVTGVTTGRWIRIYQGEINVKHFGAKGDNVTNDYTPINNAIIFGVSINSQSGTIIYFPEGTYLISQRITIPNRIGLRGANGRSTIIKPFSSFSDTYMFHSVNGTSSMFASFIHDMYIDARGFNMTSVVYSQAWQETCGLERVVIQFDGTTANGFEYSNGYSGAAYLQLKDIEIFSNSTNISACGIKVNQIGSVGAFIFSVDGCTIAGTVTNVLPIGISLNNETMIIKGYHIEYTVNGIRVFGVASLSCNTYTGSFNSITNMIDIDAGFTGMINLTNIIPNGSNFILKDNVNSRNIAGSEGRLPDYTYQNSAFSISVGTTITDITGNGVETVVIFDTESYDYKSEYNNTTGIFTAKRAGKYLFTPRLQVNIPVGSTSLVMYLNSSIGGNTDLYRSNVANIRDTGNNVIVTGSAVLDLAQNETVRLYLGVYGIGANTADINATKSRMTGLFLYR